MAGPAMSSAVAKDNQNSKLVSQRLPAVKGDRDKTNDVFVYGEMNSQQHVIYFGGDVQDYPENMEGDNARHVQWNVEKTASLLYHKFPASLVFVIKAKEMHLNIFAVYSNFVEVNDFGGPIHCSMHGATKHLTLLYKSACKMVSEICWKQKEHADDKKDSHCSVKETELEKSTIESSKENEENESKLYCDQNVPVSIIGFSKGCVVLNQLVFELPSGHDCEVKDFLSKISDIYWLDGGHNGGDLDHANQHAYVTEPKLVKLLANLGCGIHVHVTPYQVHCSLRPWLGKHHRRFCQLLRNAGANFHNELHFEQEPGSLESHFRLLETFKT